MTSTGLGTGLRTSLIIIALGFGGVASIATVLAFFGASWWLFDLFANFRWQLAWVAIIAAVVYALTAKGLAAIVFVAAAIVNAFILAPAWFGSQPPGIGEDGVRVVSVDLYGGTDDEEFTLRWLFDSDADVLIASGVSDTRLAPLVTDGSPYRLLVAPEPDTTGVAVIGRDDYEVDTTIVEDTGEAIHVIRVPSGDGTIGIVTAWGKLATNSGAAGALDARIDAIGSIVEARSEPLVVIGNLGTTRYAHALRSLLSTDTVRDATEGSGYLSTWPVSGFPIIGGWAGIPLDLVLMTDEITPLDLMSGPDIGAGHLPMTVVVGERG
ncbi:hypothetical protein ACFLQ7_03020 [Actinomycetota bacterium]